MKILYLSTINIVFVCFSELHTSTCICLPCLEPDAYVWLPLINRHWFPGWCRHAPSPVFSGYAFQEARLDWYSMYPSIYPTSSGRLRWWMMLRIHIPRVADERIDGITNWDHSPIFDVFHQRSDRDSITMNGGECRGTFVQESKSIETRRERLDVEEAELSFRSFCCCESQDWGNE